MHNQDRSNIEISTMEWVRNVVVGLNLCPFANMVVKTDDLRVHVETSDDMATVLAAVVQQCDQMLANEDNSTVLLVLPNGYSDFDNFLDLVDHAQALLADLALEGVVQIATFHPQYQFEDAPLDDNANYTNRSPYPMLHLLQERVVEQALESYPDPESIPQRNIERLRSMDESQLKRLALRVPE